MPRKQKYSFYNTHNHHRVEVFKVTHNKQYNNFLIGQNYLYEKELLFVYDKDGQHFEKRVPLKYIGPHLKQRKLMHYNENDLKFEYRGMAFEVPPEIIFNY